MKNPKARLRSKADKLWYNKYLKECCEICGDDYHLQAYHFYYRSSYGHLRYSKQNHITLCQRCHFILHHQDPKRITDQIIEKRGERWHKELQEKALTKPKPSFQTIKYYRNKIKELE